MDYGERPNREVKGNFTPDMLPHPELPNGERTNIDKNLGRVNVAAAELSLNTSENFQNNSEAVQNSAEWYQNNPEAFLNPVENSRMNQDDRSAELGEIRDESVMTKPLTEEVLLSTETGSIPDKDGVEKDIEERVQQIQHNPDLGKRSTEYALARRQFMVGRYADRAYMRGDGEK